MKEPHLGIIEDTLFIPLLGRIYASEHCRHILYDAKALSMKPRLPKEILVHDKQTQYTLLASASRSANVDCHIRDFLTRKPHGIIVQIGCGLETTFFRNDNKKTRWYAVDLPNVIEYRRKLLLEPDREKYIAGDAFNGAWLRQIRIDAPAEPILVVASGFFYYFKESRVLKLISMLQGHGDIELLFDAVNKSGMTLMKWKYMKDVGHENATMYFHIDSIDGFVRKIGGNVKIRADEKLYSRIDKSGLKISTRISMALADWFSMVKMIHLDLDGIT